MMSQRIALFDAWLCEVEEATHLAEDIESRIRERDSILRVGGDPHDIVSGARRKLMVLGTKLDRLESLLQNPPAKPILNERDLCLRQDMILDIRQRTKNMAIDLCTSQLTHKTHTHDGKTSLLAAATEKATGTDSCAIIYFQGQTTKDAELVCSKATESETKHIVITAEEENSSHAPLLDGRSKDGDVNQSPLRSLQNSLLMLYRWINGTRSATSLFLIAVAVVIVILILGIIAVMSSI